jgi:DNA-binding NarL/FixJ family response regulator
MPTTDGLEAVRANGRVAAPQAINRQGQVSAVLWHWLTPHEQTAVRHVLAQLPHLTPKQWEIVHLLCQSHTNHAIADHFYLSRRTIENYLTALFAQLGLADKNGPLNRNAILLKAYQIHQLESAEF